MKLSLGHCVLLAALVGCSNADALVGGRCLEGWTPSGDRCEVASSPSTGPSIPHEFPSGTATPPDEPPAGSGQSGSGGPVVWPEGDAGSTTSAITVDADASAPIVCDSPLVACHGACIPVQSDAENCGACGKVCSSNICVDGECQGALAGDVILLGHDFASSWSSSAQAKMLANAVSIPTTDPIRVLAFDGANPAASTERALISSSIDTRAVAYDLADDVTLEAADLARRFDVVLLQSATNDPAALGARWSTALDTFTKKGGVVVALDDGASDMPALLRTAGLLGVDGHSALESGTHVFVTAPNDALGVQVLSPFAPTGASVSFFGLASASDVTVVARAAALDGPPTAIHRFVR